MLSGPPTPLVILFSLGAAVPFAVLGWLARTRRVPVPHWLLTALSDRTAPSVLGAGSAALALFVWGSLQEPGVIHDEQAYLLQAEIFARARWTGVLPPLPEFFEQVHVLVEPRLASKYPPGHSLLLVPGIWLGLPGLIPLALGGLCGGLVFAVARKCADPTVALVTWALWSTSTPSLFYRSSFLSQNTSAALWLVAVWALLQWRSTGQPRHLATLTATMGWVYLSRPLTAIGLAAPIIVVVAVAIWRRRSWRPLALAAGILLAILVLQLIWQQRTMGHWLASPYAEYSRQYFPFVKPGFGVDPTPPLRNPPAEAAWVGRNAEHLHAAHRPGAIPRILAERTAGLLLTLGQHWRMFLVLLFAWAALTVRGPTAFGLASLLLLLVAYVVYAHPALWVVYYAEVFPVFFFLSTVKLVELWKRMFTTDPRALQGATALALLLMTPWMAGDVTRARQENDAHNAFHRAARQALARVPAHSVVFVAPAPRHDASLMRNSPDYRTAPVWVVLDRGADNERLLQMTDRQAFRLHTGDWTLERLR
jgi:hypothetical protein